MYTYDNSGWNEEDFNSRYSGGPYKDNDAFINFFIENRIEFTSINFDNLPNVKNCIIPNLPNTNEQSLTQINEYSAVGLNVFSIQNFGVKYPGIIH